MVGDAWRLRGALTAAVLGVAIVSGSCTSAQRGAGGFIGGAPPAPSPTATPKVATYERRTYYAATDGLKVYGEPSASSKILGTLSLHEKVTRSKLERGYAFVVSDKSGLAGWVDNAQLLWRLPPPAGASAPVEPEPEETVAPAAEGPLEPATPEPTPIATQPLPTMVPEPTARPISPPTPRPVGPSIFNPY